MEFAAAAGSALQRDGQITVGAAAVDIRGAVTARCAEFAAARGVVETAIVDVAAFLTARAEAGLRIGIAEA